MRGNELICDTCKLETQLQEGGEGWGIQLVVTQTYQSGQRRAAGSGEPGHAQSPVSGLNGIPLKESPSHDKKTYVPFPNILSQGSDADSMLCIPMVLCTLSLRSPLSL